MAQSTTTKLKEPICRIVWVWVLFVLAPYMLHAAPKEWKKPELKTPTILDVTDDSPAGLTQGLDTSKDYIIRLGKNSGGKVVRESITVTGGRNIQIIGGHFARPGNTPASDSKTGERLKHHGVMLGISGQSGIFYAENVLIDANKQYGVDAIGVGASQKSEPSSYMFHKIHIRGVHGASKGNQADGLQVVGPVNKLWLNKVTIVSSCQGLAMEPFWPLKDVWLNQVNLRYENPDARAGGANCFALWLGNGKHTHEQINSASYEFNDVYVEERLHYFHFNWGQASIGPSRGSSKGNWPYQNDENKAYFPDYNTKGYITRGIPMSGDFVPINTFDGK